VKFTTTLDVTSINKGAITHMSTHFLNMHDIILVINDIVMLLS